MKHTDVSVMADVWDGGLIFMGCGCVWEEGRPTALLLLTWGSPHDHPPPPPPPPPPVRHCSRPHPLCVWSVDLGWVQLVCVCVRMFMGFIRTQICIITWVWHRYYKEKVIYEDIFSFLIIQKAYKSYRISFFDKVKMQFAVGYGTCTVCTV